MKNSRIKHLTLDVLKKNAGTTAVLVITVCGAVIISLIPPQLLKRIIDDNLVPKNGEGLLELAVAYMAAIIFIGVFDFIKEAVLTVLGQKMTTGIRIEMMRKLERVSAGFFSINESGAVVSRLTNDVETIGYLFTGGIAGMTADCFKIIGIVLSIWIFSARLGVITIVLLPVIYGITRLFQKNMLKAQMKNRIIVGQVNNRITDSLRNAQMIKAFSKEEYMEGKYVSDLEENFNALERVNFQNSIFPPVIQMIRAVIIGMVVVLSSGRWNNPGISLGMVAASIDLLSALFIPIEAIGMELQSIQQAVSGIRRVNEFFEEPEDSRKNDDLKVADIIPSREDITFSFHHVYFQYNKETVVLKNIDLDIRQQQKVTFVGRTGVGKTTLFKLVTGLLQPTAGSITINGIDVCAIPNTEKRRIFGYVDQNFYMVKGTVAEQISLGDISISRDQIENALDFVGLREYVDTLENGLDTQVVKESVFSQGQKQLLAIARAIVTDPPILLLDEMSANLDSITEEKMVSVLKKVGRGHTILNISHRLSSMIASDKIVVLENGSVKNAGSPEILWIVGS